MKTDRELLELAAKAAGLEIAKANQAERDALVGREAAGLWLSNGKTWWNPLTDDGDALRLAVALGLVVDCSRPSAGEPFKQHHIWLDETASNEALTRRAIVSAAAEIGEAR